MIAVTILKGREDTTHGHYTGDSWYIGSEGELNIYDGQVIEAIIAEGHWVAVSKVPAAQMP